MIHPTFIRWNALLVLFTLLYWLATVLLGPAEQPKDSARPETKTYRAQRHDALRSASGAQVRDRQAKDWRSPTDPVARRGQQTY